ncbi:MAG: hypothetical protein CMJ47_07085 [Planctomyces sp.]|nr:hypothetical protein [Planctomyces sp.]
MHVNSTRRQFLQSAVSTAAVLAVGQRVSAKGTAAYPPTRVITQGPKHHWFGYYDKLQFDPTSRFVLGMEVDFEHRSPRADDIIKVGVIDLQDNDRWSELGQTTAWNWQQGCMLQWIPGTQKKVLWNDREGDRFVCHILDVETGATRTVPHPIYSLSPDGKTAVTPDFRRIADVRPGYGYTGLSDPHQDDLAPEETGIFRVDLETGKSELIISLAQIAELGEIPNAQPGIKHYFNHLLFSPDGSRFIALHRWRYPNGKRLTRMITANPDGSDIRIVIPNGYASHFIWRDPEHILSQSKEFLGNPNWGNFLFEDVDGGGDVQEVGHGVLNGNGHLSYLPGNEWLLNDTYPQGPNRLQTPHLYHLADGKRVDLGQFPLPKVYTGEWRVDTHPRFSPDSRYVCIDAPVENQGRQMHLIDISDIV